MKRARLSRRKRQLSADRIAVSLRYRSKWLLQAIWSLVRLGVTGPLMAGLRLGRHLTGESALTDALRKGLWRMNSSYRSSAHQEAGRDSVFQSILARIATGDDVAPAELLPYLCLEGRAERREVNALLAEAYTQNATTARLEQARVFIQRAWLLSEGAADLLPLYVKVLSALKDVASIREAYKRLGMKAAGRRDISEAIRYFDAWQWAYMKFERLDRYEYDLDILDCMDDLAAPHRIPVARRAAPADNEKIKLAYVLRGITEPNSILIKISLEFAQHHDRSRFEVTFFTPEPERTIALSPQGKEYLKLFESFGYQVITPPPLDSMAETLLALAGKIRDSQPHILITNAALADFSQYFITTLRPAPIVMGLVQGPPAQFAPPALDWCIAWTKHPLMDCPVNCSWVEIKLDYQSQDFGEAYSREALLLPDDACVLMSGGRHAKFQSQEFWQAIADLLALHPNAYYVAVGPRDDEIPFLSSILPPEVRPRVRCLGWREDFLKILPAADILIDTYPNGGGQVIVQAMALGIPLVGHRNDYMRLFDQTDWSPIEDFITDPEIIVPRGDFAEFKRVVSRLIKDKEYRRNKGERIRAEHVRCADPTRAIRRCEEVYTSVLKLMSPGGGSA